MDVAVVEEGGEAEDEDEEAGDPTAVEVLAARLLLYVGAPQTERPQSAILTMPREFMSRLEGLRSRCMTPQAWIADSPSRICFM